MKEELFDELMNILTPRMKAQLAKSLHNDIVQMMNEQDEAKRNN
tara:strand:- start:814 stop:945 length:132 start_codon:yes stop_codon:yes gene_type:complete